MSAIDSLLKSTINQFEIIIFSSVGSALQPLQSLSMNAYRRSRTNQFAVDTSSHRQGRRYQFKALINTKGKFYLNLIFFCQLNDLWNSLSGVKKIVVGIIFVNSLVLLSGRILARPLNGAGDLFRKILIDHFYLSPPSSNTFSFRIIQKP